jgi:homoserine O-succinyltransferase
VEAHPELTIMASSDEAGIYAIKTENGKQIFLMGHAEYDRDTLKNEYLRDVKAGRPIDVPKHYFPDDDPSKTPIVNWRSSGHMIYANWVNYILYQTTPYDITAIGR